MSQLDSDLLPWQWRDSDSDTELLFARQCLPLLSLGYAYPLPSNVMPQKACDVFLLDLTRSYSPYGFLFVEW